MEANLMRVLESIAAILISSGYSYGRLSKLARRAFVEAAKSVLDNSCRISVARIAASTGLTRTEVSQIIRRSNRDRQRQDDPLNRSARVASGWVTDRDFLDPNNRPRALAFSGEPHDFAALVKRYSGDIPARAMLVEMRRLGMVSQNGNVVQLVRQTIRVSNQTASLMRAVAPWISLLNETSMKAQSGRLSTKLSKINLYFDSIPQVNAVMRALNQRQLAFVEGISSLGMRAAQNSNYALDVAIAVAVARPVRTKK